MMWFFNRKKDKIPTPDEIEALNRAFKVRDAAWKRKLHLLEKQWLNVQDDDWKKEEALLIVSGEIQEPYVHKKEEKC